MSEHRYIEKKEEMKLYNKMHQDALFQNYIFNEDIGLSSHNVNDTRKVDLAKHIYNNLHNMDYYEKKKLLDDCFSEKKLDSELLTFELKYLHSYPVSYMEINEFEQVAKSVLQRYQWKVGGYYIEDLDWISHRKGSKYVLGNNQLVLENTIDTMDYQSSNFIEFMKKILVKLSNLAENISVDIKYDISKTDSLTWIIIKCTDNTRKEKKIEL